MDRWGFRGREYEKAIALAAHELFHAWNGKRIRPEPLGPFDYTRENYTRNLWVVEGFTTYYTEVVLRRAGVLSPQRFLERLGDAISSYLATPGRLRQTLEESSFDTWTRFYRPDENSPNALISYYQKGMLVAMLLDLRIRETTDNRRSLDDVLRLLWERYGERDVGFPEAGIEALVEEVCGERLDDFFAKHLRSTEELDFESHLRAAGLELVPATSASAAAGAPPSPVLGLRLKEEGGRTVVTHVLADTPSYRAGIGAGDQLLALDGLRVSARDLPARIQERREGEEVALTLFRRDELLTLALRVEHRAPPRVTLRRTAPAAPLQTAVYESWLGIGTSPALPGVDESRRRV